MTNPIVDSLLKRIGAPELLSVLSERMSLSELQSLLLEVYRVRAEQITPGELLRRYRESRYANPSRFSARAYFAIEQLLPEILPQEYEFVVLSPVVPLGTSSVVAPVSQNKVLSTVRTTEVVSDPTNAMALACAVRRQAQVRSDAPSVEATRLAAVHQMLRTQRTGIPGPSQHLRMFTLCTASHAKPSHSVEVEETLAHSAIYQRLTARLSGYHAISSLEFRIKIVVYGESLQQADIERRIADPLRQRYPNTKVSIVERPAMPETYYKTLSFHIAIRKDRGRHLPIADGGSLDWTQKLLANKKERFFASGINLDQLCRFFG